MNAQPKLSPFMSIVHGFAQARERQTVEREVHDELNGERPEGDGWVRIPHKDYDPYGYALWERRE